MFGRPLWTILLALERCLLDVAHRDMTLDWENLRLFGHLREKFLIQENAVSKLEIWIMMN